jgi:flagellar basal body P-ring protein FlgI
MLPACRTRLNVRDAFPTSPAGPAPRGNRWTPQPGSLRWSLGWSLIWGLLLCLFGASVPVTGADRKGEAITDDEAKPKKLSFIGDQVAVTGLHLIQIESVGLVDGLEGTGGDTPPSLYRRMLIEEMHKRGVRSPNALLEDPNKALVVVRGSVPPNIRVGERFDVEVAIPESSPATSLRSGYLLEVNMAEQAMVPGRGPRSGHTLGKAEGPILLSTGEVDSDSKPSVLKRGRIPGGGVYTGGLQKADRLLGLYLRSDLRGGRQTERIADAIGRRYFDMLQGRKVPMAKAKTDQYIELRVPERYRENFMHYLQVVRAIAINESIVEQRERLERLRRSLFTPESAGRASLELEAIGSAEAKLILREGLEQPDLEVRFYSANALAYLGDAQGTAQLALAARNEPAFRVFALAALATLDREPAVIDALRNLMTQPTVDEKEGQRRESWSAETRYGALRALETVDRHREVVKAEPIYGESILRTFETPDGEPTRQKKPRPEFVLHVIDSPGEPMVHLTRHRRSELAIFGSDQRLKTPLSLQAGRILVTAPSGSETVTISRYETQREIQQVQTSTRLVEVVRAIGRLDGSYPDIAQMLVTADRQSNLEGRLEFDALPKAGRIYYRPDGTSAESESGSRKIRVGAEDQAPNIFPSLLPTRKTPGPKKTEDDEATTVEGSLALDNAPAESEEKSESAAPPPKRGLLNLMQKK